MHMTSELPSHSMDYIFIFWWCILKKFFTLMKCKLLPFKVVFHDFLFYLDNTYLSWCYRDFFPNLFSQNLIDRALTFISVIHFKLLFCVVLGKGQCLLFLIWITSCCGSICWKQCSLFCWIILLPLLKWVVYV